ncbi:MAG: type I restriction enzyme HsdR N-terminal domain-containing protein [Candidatus Zixiibacteriota bacterium]
MVNDIRLPLKKFIPHFLQAQQDNLNEADTVMRISKFFEDVLGYDALFEISRETHLKGKFVDIAIKIDGVIKLLVEVKAAGVTLRDRHIEQAEAYASRSNYRWVLLTNGVVWNLYHLTFDQGIEYERAFSVDLTVNSLDEAVERLGLLSKASVRKGEHEKYWEKRTALSPSAIGMCLFQKDVLMLIRREIRRQCGSLIDPEDLATAIHAMLSPEARELIGPRRIHRARPKKRLSRPEGSEIVAQPKEARGDGGDVPS